eukprot:6206011-Pleurochrysis_carterae.AAC.1
MSGEDGRSMHSWPCSSASIAYLAFPPEILSSEDCNRHIAPEYVSRHSFFSRSVTILWSSTIVEGVTLLESHTVPLQSAEATLSVLPK